MLCAIYKVERSEESQPPKKLNFQAIWSMVSIPNVAMKLYSRLKIRKFKGALATKESIECVRLCKPHRDEGQPELRRRSKLKQVFKTGTDCYFFFFFPNSLHSLSSK